MKRGECSMSYEERKGIEYNTCNLAAKISAINPIERYNELMRRGCSDGDCVYRSGKPTRKGASLLSVL